MTTQVDICGWTENTEGAWDTGCGHVFMIDDGTPEDNDMKFCCFCGKPLEQTVYAPIQ